MIKKHKKTIPLVFLIVLSVILLLLVVIFSYQRAYAGKIYRNVYLGDINLSGKTKKQAEFIIQNKFNSIGNTEITLSANEKTIKTKISDTGLTFDIANIVDDCYLVGRVGNFWDTLKTSTFTIYKKNTVAVSPEIDDADYQNFLKNIVAQLNATATDATLAIQDGQVIVTPEKDGQTVRVDNLADKIIALDSTATNKVISLDTEVSHAQTTSLNVDTAKTQAQNYLTSQITFTYNAQRFSPTKTQQSGWIEFTAKDGQVAASINQTNLRAYLNTIAKNFEVTALDRKINANTGEVIEAGRDGVYLNKDQAISDLTSQIGKAAVAITLATTTTPAKELRVLPEEGVVLGRFSGKYIDVDLTKQKLCRIDGQNLVDCFIVSTGKPSMPTPTGTYAIQSKNPRKWSAEYGLWMPWWEQWNGPYGIHELPEWPNGYKEGEAHLGIPVSHGCIRLGVGPAETVYNWTDIGTPVYIHK